MSNYVIHIPTKCVPKGRPRFVLNKYTGKPDIYTPKKTKDYEKFVAECSKSVIKKPIENEYLEISIIVFFEIPKSWNKLKKQQAEDGIVKPGYSDVDNLAKSILDGMNKVVFADDRQIVKITVEKRYGQKSEAIVFIRNT